ncbi:MAG: PQQ-binding-like beta-propeller repeat protein [bacterium]
MKKFTFLLFVALFFIFFLVFVMLLADQICLAADTSEKVNLAESAWPCKGYDSKRTGQSPYEGMQTDSILKWVYQTGKAIWSSPSIGVEGAIYVGGYDGKLYALNPDGSLKWNYLTEGPVISSPAIDSEGIIYVGSEDNRIYAFNPEGSPKWSYLTGGKVRSSPAIGTDGTIYTGSDDGNVYALNQDGSLKWSCQTGGGVCSSPAIDVDGTIYVGSDTGKLLSINAAGSLNWSFEVGAGVYTTPVIGVDGTVYVGLDKIYALNPEDGSLKWSYNKGASHFSSPAAGTDGTIFFIQPDMISEKSAGCCINCFGPPCKYDHEFYGTVYALDPNGVLKWSYRMGGFFYLNSNIQYPTIFRFPDSFVPILAGDGTVYAGNYDGKVYALDPNGTLKDTYQTGGHVFSSPAIGDDGTVYIGSNDGKLRAFGGDKYCYLDFDNDGRGDPNQSIQTSICPQGYVENNLDCNDKDASTHPGASELCDGKDNDCDGQMDIEGSEGCTIYYKDADNDWQGDAGNSQCLCSPDEFNNHTAIYSGDPDDSDPNIQGTILTGNISIPAGWSMFSLPLKPGNASLSSLFPDAVVMYSYEKEKGYVRIRRGEDMEAGTGYWILLNGEKTLTITGEVVNQYNLTIQEGWHMIGGCTFPAQPSVDDCKIKVIYGYNQGHGYQTILESEELKPGKGYWILLEDVEDRCELTIEITDPYIY